MSRPKRMPYSKDVFLSLALGISISCGQIAASDFTRADTPSRTRNAESMTEEERLRASIKKATSNLGELSLSLGKACHFILNDASSRKAVEEEAFIEIASTLRELEVIVAARQDIAQLPVLGPKYQALRRALAQARSQAAQNAMLIQQQRLGQTLFESDVSAEGLASLASLGSARIHGLLS